MSFSNFTTKQKKMKQRTYNNKVIITIIIKQQKKLDENTKNERESEMFDVI